MSVVSLVILLENVVENLVLEVGEAVVVIGVPALDVVGVLVMIDMPAALVGESRLLFDVVALLLLLAVHEAIVGPLCLSIAMPVVIHPLLMAGIRAMERGETNPNE